MKQFILSFIRRKAFQPFWEKLAHWAKIGMNHWGAGTVEISGEQAALVWALGRATTGNVIIFDIGANTGQFAIMAGTAIGGAIIYSFEPSRKTFAALEKNLSPHLAKALFRPQNVGVGSVPGNMTLYSSEEQSTIASVFDLKNPLRPFDAAQTEQITITTVDIFCEQNGIKSIDYLKIDIEGFEFEAIKGALNIITRGGVRYIQFEFGEGTIDARVFFRDFYELFIKDRYSMYRIVSDGVRRIDKYSVSLEAFETVNYLCELIH
jgi:FkbM family methyltransferase